MRQVTTNIKTGDHIFQIWLSILLLLLRKWLRKSRNSNIFVCAHPLCVACLFTPIKFSSELCFSKGVNATSFYCHIFVRKSKLNKRWNNNQREYISLSPKHVKNIFPPIENMNPNIIYNHFWVWIFLSKCDDMVLK